MADKLEADRRQLATHMIFTHAFDRFLIIGYIFTLHYIHSYAKLTFYSGKGSLFSTLCNTQTSRQARPEPGDTLTGKYQAKKGW